MREVLSALRDEETAEHAKINSVLSTLDSTATDRGLFERLRRLETLADTLKDHIADLEDARAKDLADQAALGKKVQVTLVTLLVAIAGVAIPSMAKLFAVAS